MDWFVTVLKRYAVFKGRAGRPEYWYFTLIWLVIAIVLAFVDGILGTLSMTGGIGLLSGVFGLALFLPALAVTVRRLHDSDRNGWWCLFSLVPFVGPLLLVVLMVLKGSAGPNRFGSGPNPPL
jgi:uncharacterized membrane protein YhaH (DUF805 family)